MEALFWIAALLIVYPYLGYPVLLATLRPFCHRKVARAPHTPVVSLIIPAHNEATNIARKLDNALELAYPRECLQIIVASDASEDGTDEIVRGFAGRGVELVVMSERRGKVAAQNAAIGQARGEVLVFSDARILLSPGSVAAMMENFADPRIGCVSSVDRVVADDEEGEGGEGLYVRYEMWLRDLEAATGTLIGASGSFYAVRRELAGIWPEGLTRDFLTPLKVAEAGYRNVAEPRAVGTYHALPSAGAEFHRKVRTVMRGMAVLFHMRRLLDPFRYPGVALRLWSHKILRWTVPFALLGLAGSSLVLAARGGVYALALAAQLGLYTLAAAGAVNSRLESRWIVRLPLFFANVNLSILLAWIRTLRGSRQVTWEPTRR